MSLLDDVFVYGSQHEMFSCSAILIAVSGGSDSVCLLDILWRLREEKRASVSHSLPFPEVFAVHVNHQIRPEASEDETMVRALCEEKNVSLFVRTYDVPYLAKKYHHGLEETGRDMRREAYADVSKEIVSLGYSTVFIATAHHREDVCETILMNFFRGSGTDGLTGMSPRASQMIRPLLFANKEQILAYVCARDIPYSEDSTNSDGAYTRNAFRNEILPAIAKATRRDPVDSCLRTADRMKDDAAFLEDTAGLTYETFVVRRGDIAGLSCETVISQARAISGRMIRMLYKETFGSLSDFTTDHIEAVRDLCMRNKSGKRISLPERRRAVTMNGIVFFATENDVISKSVALFPREERLCIVPTNKVTLELEYDFKSNNAPRKIPQSLLEAWTFGVEKQDQVVYNDRTWYAYAKTLEGAVLRTMRSGDRFRRAGSSGHKPLRRLFTDEKIAREIRDRILLVARGDEVLWIPGMYHAEGFIDESSRLRFQKEINADGSTQYAAQDELVCVMIREIETKGTFVDA